MTLAPGAPQRAEIWLLDFDPTKGREQAGKRPALVLSADVFNSGPAKLAIVCPITSRDRKIRSHIQVMPPEGGLTMASFIMAEHIKSVSTDRFLKRIGVVSATTMGAVEIRIRLLLNLI